MRPSIYLQRRNVVINNYVMLIILYAKVRFLEFCLRHLYHVAASSLPKDHLEASFP
jgi:hypothetical protein